MTRRASNSNSRLLPAADNRVAKRPQGPVFHRQPDIASLLPAISNFVSD
jgi:hypothetical protein